MTPLAEKRYNSAVNVWVREPALVCTATLGFIQIHLQPSMFGWLSVIRVFLCVLATWNGLFFMERFVQRACVYRCMRCF